MIFNIAVLRDFIVELLNKNGIKKDDANLLADVLLKAELWNIKSHGLSRLKRYIMRLNNNTIKVEPNIKFEQIYPSVISVDGDNGLGGIVMNKVLDFAEKIADKQGICAVGVRNSNHFGIAGYYCEKMAKKGYITIGLTNALAAMAPWGGKETYLGTNPIAFGFPKKDFPIIVDMATSAVARGKILLAAKEDKIIPDNWATDKQGNKTVDPKKAVEGLLLPMAGPKGYALSLSIDILAGVLTGALFGNKVGAYKDGLKRANIGHLFILIKKDSFIDEQIYEKRIESMSIDLHNIEKKDDVENIYLPGEREHLFELEQLKNGINISTEVYKDLITLKEDFALKTDI